MLRRTLLTSLLLALAAMGGFAIGRAQETPANSPPPQLRSLEDQASYAIGLDIGRSILADKLPIKPDLVARGLLDALKKSPPLLSDEQIQEVMTKFSQLQQASQAAETKTAGDKNLKEGQAFLVTNKAKQGVLTTQSGLQYQVVKSGAGAFPKATDVVRVHYHGTFIDGTVFDSSIDKKQPAEFPVNRVIPGWTEALQKMKVGDKWRLFVPSDLAYGPPGRGPIPPNTVLIFDVELLEIVR
jgi:FKBP-type peptidyl-prolyl cis-trans isomerase